MTAAMSELSIEQLGEQAAEAVRALNQLTRPGIGALTEPAEVCDLVADLACLTHRLPQLLAQLSGWLHAGQQHGRLRVDAFSSTPDPAASVAATIEALTQASTCAQHTGRALDDAHQHLAHLASADSTGDADDEAERS